MRPGSARARPHVTALTGARATWRVIWPAGGGVGGGRLVVTVVTVADMRLCGEREPRGR